MDSSWYYMRYACPHYDEGPLDKEAVKYWMMSINILAALNMRFYTCSILDFSQNAARSRIVDFDEPFDNLLTQGIGDQRWRKMSKSFGNVVDPDSRLKNSGPTPHLVLSCLPLRLKKNLDWSDQAAEGFPVFESFMAIGI